jgi:integrase
MKGKLRKKLLKGGKYSLFIDYSPKVWNPHTKTYIRKEYLKIYLHVRPQTFIEKQENAMSMEVAEKIYIKRMKALMLDENGIFNRDILEGDFYIYFENFIHNKKLDEVEAGQYNSAIGHLKKWRPENLKFRHIDELFLEGFKAYLRTAYFLKSQSLKLSANSKASYYDKVAYVVQQAFINRYLTEDYTLRVKRLPNVDSTKERLEQEDVRILIQNPCEDSMTYRSSIFGLLTGFRFSAIEVLKWEHLHYSMDLACWYVLLVDPKPGRPFKHFISSEAMEVLGEKKEGNKFVFEGIKYHQVRYALMNWFDDVGLKSKSRFHNWRRRYASDLSDNNVDIYVIKDMLNHKFVQTTEIYTNNSDKNKANAAKLIAYK